MAVSVHQQYHSLLLQLCLKPIQREELPLSEGKRHVSVSPGIFKNLPYRLYFFAEKRVQYMVYFFCLVPLPELPFEKVLKEFFCNLYSRCTRFCIAAGDTVTGISRSLSVLYFCCYFPAEQLFSPQVPFCLLFYQAPVSETAAELSASPENEFLTLLTEKNKEKAKKLSLIISFCIITRIRMFCLTRPRISITNYSVLWIMLRVS